MTPKGHLQHPHCQIQERKTRHQGAQKPNQAFRFPWVRPALLQSGAHLANDPRLHRIKIQKVGSSSIRLSYSALLLGRTTNAWTMGASVDDVPTLSSLGWVVWTMGATTGALPPGMVRTYPGFWPFRLLCRRRPLRTHRPPAGQEGFRTGKLIIQNAKSDHPFSQEIAAASSHQHK
jgi:hypothetical protein